MARLQFKRVGTTTAWAASGSISMELSPLPFTMTQLLVVVHADITTTSATWYSDAFDRFMTKMALTGQVDNQNKTFFDFSSMRAAYHHGRFKLGRFSPKRPTKVADSATNSLLQYAYLFHFGVRPELNGKLNPMDLTAGIPPTQKGQLTLSGTFGAAAAMGSNVTVNATSSGFIEVYAIGVAPENEDAPQLYTAQAFPTWSEATITGGATTTTFGTSYNVTAGGFLRSLMYLATNGSNAPRDRVVLSDFRLYHQLENREIIAFGGRAGLSDASGGDYEVGEIYSQLWLGGAQPGEWLGDNGGTSAPAVPQIAQQAERGLLYLPLDQLTTKVHPLYGADLRKVATGDLRIDRGLADVTGTTEELVYERYELNPAHPANAGWL